MTPRYKKEWTPAALPLRECLTEIINDLPDQLGALERTQARLSKLIDIVGRIAAHLPPSALDELLANHGYSRD